MSPIKTDVEYAPTVNMSPGPEFGLANRQWQGVPGIERTPSGRLWAVWYTGGEREPRAENHVLLATSEDDGQSWTEPVAVVSPEGEWRSFDAVLWHDPLGRLWWFWSLTLGEVDGRYGVWGAYTDDAETSMPKWSSPRRICNGIMMNKPVVLGDGRWALPAAVWDVDPRVKEMADERFSNMIVSEDNGETFFRIGGADIPDRAYDEHHIVERLDGTLWMLVRTHYGIGQSISVDGGKTWSSGEPTGITHADSRFFIRRLKSGKLLLIHHGVSDARSHLTASLSDDDGKTWCGDLLLDERLKVSYPDAVEADDGRIFVIYDHNRYSDKEILMAIITEQDVAAGRLVSGDAVLKRTVSKPVS